MLEKVLERKLVKAVRDSGGLALKFVSPGMAGVPDRLLLFPGGRAAFAEVKATGRKPPGTFNPIWNMPAGKQRSLPTARWMRSTKALPVFPG